MATNFKPMFWSKYIQTELEKDLILANWCDYQYDGELKEGSRLKIIGAVRPTIGTYTPGNDISVEDLGDNSQYLDITQADYFAFYVDDIDKVQSMPSALETQFSEAKKALAEKADAFIGEQAKNANSDMMSSSTDISGATSAFTVIDAGMQRLYENNVSVKTELAIELNAEHLILCRKELADIFTDNNEYIKKGVAGKYNNAYIKLSNNLYNDGTDDYEMIRTKKAIAFAGQIDKVETCKAEKRFADIIKGLHVYGAKVVRPQELYVIKVH